MTDRNFQASNSRSSSMSSFDDDDSDDFDLGRCHGPTSHSSPGCHSPDGNATKDYPFGPVRVLSTPAIVTNYDERESKVVAQSDPSTADEPAEDVIRDPEDQDLSHLLSDLLFDDILDVQESQYVDGNHIQPSDIVAESSTCQTFTDQSGENASQPSMTSGCEAPPDENGTRSVSFQKQVCLQDLQQAPIRAVLKEASTNAPIVTEEFSSASPATLLDKDNLLREIQNLQMDRDVLQQQLYDARSELDTARQSLQKNIHDLEHELQTMKQSRQRLDESRENESLEIELWKLAGIARDQEEMELAAKKRAEEAALRETSLARDKISGFAETRGARELGDETTKKSGIDHTTEIHSSQFYQDQIANLEGLVKTLKFREQLLEKEIQDLRDHAFVESQKFLETQRQVSWLQREVHIMYEDDEREGELQIEQTRDLEIIPEDSSNLDDGSISTGGENDMDPSTHENRTKRMRLLQEQRLDLENRLRNLMDEVGTLRVEKGQLQHEVRQQGLVVQQLRQDISQKEKEHRMDDMLLQRQLKDRKENAESLQKELQRERASVEELLSLQRRDRIHWSRQVDDLEMTIKDLEQRIEKERDQMSHERRLHKRAIESLESKRSDPNSNAPMNGERNETENIFARQEIETPGLKDFAQRLSTTKFHSATDCEQEKQLLRSRVVSLERDLRLSKESEESLKKNISDMKEQLIHSQDESERAADRVQILQTLLENSSSKSSISNREKSKEDRVGLSEGLVQRGSEKSRSCFQQQSGKNVTEVGTVTTPETRDLEANIQEESKSFSLKSRARLLKMKELDDMSENTSVVSWTSVQLDLEHPSTAVVYDMQQKLEHEIAQLKQRKQKLRRTSISSSAPEESSQKFRSQAPQVADAYSSCEKSKTEITRSREVFLKECDVSGYLGTSRRLARDQVEKALQIATAEKEELHTKCRALETEKNCLDHVLVQAGEKTTMLEEQHKKLEAVCTKLESSAIEWKLERGSLEATLVSKEEAASFLRQSLCRLEHENITQARELQVILQDRDTCHADLRLRANETEELKRSLDLLRNSYQELQMELCAIREENGETSSKAAALQQDNDLLATEKETLEAIRLDLESRLATLDRKVDESITEKSCMQVQLEQQSSEFLQKEQALISMITQLEEDNARTKSEELASRRRIACLTEELEIAAQKTTSMETEQINLRRDFEKTIEEKDAKITAVEIQLSELKDDVQLQLQTQIEEATNLLRDTEMRLESEKSTLNNRIENREQKVAELERQVVCLENELSSCIEEKQRVAADLQGLKERWDASEADIKVLKVTIAELQSCKQELLARVLAKDDELAKLDNNLSETLDALGLLRDVVTEKTDKISMLEAQRSDYASRVAELEREVSVTATKLGEMSHLISQKEQAQHEISEKFEDRDAEVAQSKERNQDSDRALCLTRENAIEMEQKLMQKEFDHQRYIEQLQHQEQRLVEATSQLTEMENTVKEQVTEMEILEINITELKEENEKNSNIISKQEERLSLVSFQLSEMEDILQEKESHLQQQDERLIQASLHLSEMEEIVYQRETQLKEQDSKHVDTCLRLSQTQEMMLVKGKELEAKLMQRDCRLSEASSQLTELEGLLESRNVIIEGAEAKLNALEAVVRNLEADVEKLTNDIETERSQKIRLSIDLEEVQQDLSQKTNHLDRQLKTVAKLTNHADQWQLELEDLEDANKELMCRLSALKEENESLLSELDKCRTQRDNLSKQIELVQERIARQEELNLENSILLKKFQEEQELSSCDLHSAQKRYKEANLLAEQREEQLLAARQEKDAVLKNLESLQEVHNETTKLNNVMKDELESILHRTQSEQLAHLEKASELWVQQTKALAEIRRKLEQCCPKRDSDSKRTSSAGSAADVERVTFFAETEILKVKLNESKTFIAEQLVAIEERFENEKSRLAEDVDRVIDILESHKSMTSTLESLMIKHSIEKSILLGEPKATASPEEDLKGTKSLSETMQVGESDVTSHLIELVTLKNQSESEKAALDKTLLETSNRLAESRNLLMAIDESRAREVAMTKEMDDLWSKHDEMKKEFEVLGVKAREVDVMSVKFDATIEALGTVSEELSMCKALCETQERTITTLKIENDCMTREKSALNQMESTSTKDLFGLKAECGMNVKEITQRVKDLEVERDDVTKALDALQRQVDEEKINRQDEVDGLHSRLKEQEQRFTKDLGKSSIELQEYKVLAQSRNDALLRMCSETEALATTTQQLSGENKKLTEELRRVKMEADSVERDSKMLLAELNNALDENKAVADLRLKHLAELRQEKESLSDEKDTLRSDNAKLIQETCVFNVQAEATSKELLISVLDENKATVEAHQEEIAEVLVQRDSLLVKIASLEERCLYLEDELNRRLLETKSLSEEIVSVKSQAQEMEREGEMLSKELTEFAEESRFLAESRAIEIIQLKEERDRLMRQVKQFQEEFEDLQQMSEEEEQNHKELLMSFQRERAELKRDLLECKSVIEKLNWKIQALESGVK